MKGRNQLIDYIQDREQSQGSCVPASCLINFGVPGNGKSKLEELVIGHRRGNMRKGFSWKEPNSDGGTMGFDLSETQGETGYRDEE